MFIWLIATTVEAVNLACPVCPCMGEPSVTESMLFTRKISVSNDARGARCAIAVDVDNDGDLDIVSASSTDNTVNLYMNVGSRFLPTALTRNSKGARIVTAGDIDNDGDIDIIAASYYDNTIGWFENFDSLGSFSKLRPITTKAINAQGITTSDLDGDGDLDVISASSGDNTIAWYENLGGGRFCGVKRVISNTAAGARTVIAADLDGDGDVDLASASKDNNTIAW